VSEERGTPDYKSASVVLWLATGVSVLRKAGVGYEIVERLGMLCDEIYQAVNIRGARVGELIEAVRAVRKGGSILDDLPAAQTQRHKLPMPRESDE
jgi:hypothetical protein